MEGTVDLPAVGRVKKRYVLVPAGLAAAFVAYRWYTASQSAADQPAGSDGTYASPDTSEYGLSTTGGATNIGGNTGSVSTDATNPNAIDDNAEWTQAAVERLGNAGYDSATVYAALGEFLARRSLDASEASIARAALAAAGQPPVGGPFSVIEAASTGTASPGAVTGLHVTKAGTNYVNLAWTPIPGIGEYAVYRSGAGGTASRAGAGSTTIYGLQPNVTYDFQVAAVGSAGKVGPKSASVRAKTVAATPAKPSTPTASAITRTSFRATTAAVAGATQYRWYLNGRELVGTEVPYRDFTGLKANTSYQVAVRGDGPGAVTGPLSASRSVKTKK